MEEPLRGVGAGEPLMVRARWREVPLEYTYNSRPQPIEQNHMYI
jgi:hypothetical protein